jgi:F-type H+-transporting ATPase subunit b
MALDLTDPRLWVTLSFLIFVALGYKKIAAFAANALDERSAKIKAELDAAHALRAQAEAVLEEYREKQSHYLKEAEGILASARTDADTIRAHAEKDLLASLETRMKQAVERIAQEEERAVADVRNHVVDIALAAARNIITDHVSTMSQDDLVKLALSDIERKIH